MNMGDYVFKLPDIGEGVVEGEIVTWHVKVGDSVAEDDSIVDVMTDKATVTIPSPTNGIALNKFVITVAPQKLICPQGRT